MQFHSSTCLKRSWPLTKRIVRITSIVKDPDLSSTFHYHSGPVFGNTKQKRPKRFPAGGFSNISPQKPPNKRFKPGKPAVILGGAGSSPMFWNARSTRHIFTACSPLHPTPQPSSLLPSGISKHRTEVTRSPTFWRWWCTVKICGPVLFL